MITSRRGLLLGLGATAVAGPAIVRDATRLMKIKSSLTTISDPTHMHSYMIQIGDLVGTKVPGIGMVEIGVITCILNDEGGNVVVHRPLIRPDVQFIGSVVVPSKDLIKMKNWRGEPA